MFRHFSEEKNNRVPRKAKIYLISPPRIELGKFTADLEQLLASKLVSVFQLRLKDYRLDEVKLIANSLKTVCQKYNCPIILNDYGDIAIELGFDGVHLGVDDGRISELRIKAPKNFIIGASCYDSKHLAMVAGEEGADYISFGAFYSSSTKKSQGKPTLEIVKWCDQLMNLPIVAIGGINNSNCRPLVEAGADFIAVISYIWNAKDKLGALKKLNSALAPC